MKLEQLYTGCLSEAAYYVESEGEVAIIDPLRETSPYTELAEANNAKINWLPDHIRDGRFGNFLESNVDWALSR